ncbi:MAG: AIR carboxylase family protein [Candidatus Aenigmarchaeota archaeon]|nr:AIR carboxylase family protein [Candidatus Aenigmarchaeota archaeon]
MNTNGMKIALIMGSESDLPKLTPYLPEELRIGLGGVALDTPYNVGDRYVVTLHVSSADRAPKSTKQLLRNNHADVVICAAGLNNQLAALAKQNLGYHNIEIRKRERESKPVIAVSVYDSKTGGLSSHFSTIEKPPGYSILTTGVNRADIALEMAYQIEKNNWRGIDLIPGSGVYEEDKTLKAAEETLEQLLYGSKIPFEIKSPEDIDPKRMSLLVFSAFDNPGELYDIDKASGFVIATKTGEIEDPAGYVRNASRDKINNTLFVGGPSGASLAFAAAEIFAQENSAVRTNLFKYYDA